MGLIYLTKLISTEIDNLGRRVSKVLRFGNRDVLTALEASPYGIDSNPVQGRIAIYADTGEKGKTVIVGYIDKNKLAEVGATRIYSTDANGTVKFALYMRADGTCEFGGTGDFLVRYEKMDDFMQSLKSDINTELVKIQTGITGVGGAYAPTPISINTSQAKISKIKVSSSG
jgi:hypothetical protein